MGGSLYEELKNVFEPFDTQYFENLLKEAATIKQCTEFLQSSSVYDNSIWKDLPQAPTHEKQLYEPLVAITTAILSHFGLQTSRKALDRHNVNMKTEKTEGLKSRPDIAITASGPHFQGKIAEKKKGKEKEEKEETSWHECLSIIEVKKEDLKAKKGRKAYEEDGNDASDGDGDGEDSNEDEGADRDRDESEDGGEDEEDESMNGNGDRHEDGDENGDKEGNEGENGEADREEEREEEPAGEGQQKQGNRPEQCSTETLKQLVFYAQQIFSHQPTRMFVYTILMTQCRVRVFRFDRVGVQFSKWINYQDEPFKLVQIIKLVAGADVEKAGLDKTVTFENGKMHFALQKDNKPFVVTSDPNPRFQTRSFRGRSTFCWTVYDQAGKRHILKQQFVATGRRKEHELLEEVSKLAGPGIDLTTIGQCILAQCFGKVSESRGLTKEFVTRTKFHDRELYRILLVEHGDRIGNLNGKTVLDFLVAFRDAISGHQMLWNAGIVHRDISINNILYRSKERTEATHHGVLIDFDLAVDLIRNTSNARVDFRTGTKAFQSISVLRGQATGKAKVVMLHDHVDDLQSFLWVLIWIIRNDVGPGANHLDDYDEELNVTNNFESPDNSTCAFVKAGLLSDSANTVIKIQAGWGEHIQTLAHKLGCFFFHHSNAKQINLENHLVPTPEELVETAPTHYLTVLGHFDDAIASVRKDMAAASSSTPSLLPAHDITSSTAPSIPSKSSKRSRSTKTANIADDSQASPPSVRVKRPRTSKSAPNLAQPQSQEAGSASKQPNKGKKKAKADFVARANSQGTPTETSKDRPVRGSRDAALTAAKVSDARVQ